MYPEGEKPCRKPTRLMIIIFITMIKMMVITKITKIKIMMIMIITR